MQEALEASASGSYDKTENEDRRCIHGAVAADIGVQAHVAVPCRSVHIQVPQASDKGENRGINCF